MIRRLIDWLAHRRLRAAWTQDPITDLWSRGHALIEELDHGYRLHRPGRAAATFPTLDASMRAERDDMRAPRAAGWTAVRS